MTVLASTVATPAATTWRNWFAIVLLTAVMFVCYVDRFLIAILVQPIKTDLGLSDAQVGLLTGFAFSACYALASLPIARLADRGSRRTIVTLSLAAWSVMTALCGLSQSYAQLLLARLGVGIGEAGSAPASHAMIADLVPLRRRAFAYAFFSAGGSLGISCGLAIGGVLEAQVGWRNAFFAVGVPGLLLALIVHLLLREPVRGAFGDAVLPRHADAAQAGGALRELRNNRPLQYLLLASGFSTLSVIGAAQWLPAFVERSFGLSRAEIGGMAALSQGPGMLIGILLGGLLADRLSRTDILAPFRIVIVTGIISVPFWALTYAAPTATVCFIAYFFASLISMLGTGSYVANLQFVIPPHLRASTSAMSGIASSFVGTGGGALLIGLISDAAQKKAGADSLRVALLLTVLPGKLLTILCVTLAYLRIRARMGQARYSPILDE